MIDHNELAEAKQWAEEIVDSRQVTIRADALSAALVIDALPDVIVDGNRLREVINGQLDSHPHGTVGHHVAEDLACKLQDLLPDPESASPRPEDVPVGEAWQVEIDGQAAIGYRNDPLDDFQWAVLYTSTVAFGHVSDEEIKLIARLVPDTPEQDDDLEFDPAYLYRDKDGETWEYLDGKWVQGDSRMDRRVSRNVNHGLNNLLPKFGPYTRIEKSTINE